MKISPDQINTGSTTKQGIMPIRNVERKNNEMVNFQLENGVRKVTEEKGSFKILEYEKDVSVSSMTAQNEYFMQQMNVRKRQVFCTLNGAAGIVTQAGAMQWTAGNVQATTGVKGAGDLLGKMIKGSVTKESSIKPKYTGEGYLMLEPTYKYILLEDVAAWGSGLVVEDGMFLACEGSVAQDVIARSNLSSAVAGGEGLFNLCLKDKGIVALESFVPRSELIEFTLQDDELKIDGHFAVCWSASLKFTVERSGKSLIGSAASGEGLVNVYRGTGKVLMSPVAPTNVSCVKVTV